jgi:hypothetical protein
MECDHGCSMNIFYELCESWFYEWIGAKLLGEWRDGEKKNIYMMLVEVKEAELLAKGWS